MSIDPLKLALKSVSLKSAALTPLLALYVGFTFIVFFLAVVPSYQNGTTSWTFATDSTVYTDIADSLREGRADAWVIGSLSFFPNTLWTPVFLVLLLHNALSIMLFNYLTFGFSLWLCKRALPIDIGTFVCLLLLNPTTTTSLLCVNKEILDLFAISLLLYSRRKRRTGMLVAALCLALLNRYEVCVVMLVYLCCESRRNPWREKRWTTLFFLLLTLNFAMPIWGSKQLVHRFEEAQFAGLIRLLDNLQMHYLYVLVVVPKIAEDLFGQLLNTQVWTDSSSWLFINFFNNLAYLLVLCFIGMKHRLTLQSDLLYFSALGSIIVAQALVVQPRYFYFAYVLLCLQAAHIRVRSASADFSFDPPTELNHA